VLKGRGFGRKRLCLIEVLFMNLPGKTKENHGKFCPGKDEIQAPSE
jgi:hypothetical protein